LATRAKRTIWYSPAGGKTVRRTAVPRRESAMDDCRSSMDHPTGNFVRAGSLEKLKAEGQLIVRGAHRPIAAKLGQPRGQAAVRYRAVLRTVIAIDVRGVVAGRSSRTSRRGRRVIFSVGAARRHLFACIGRLQQGETKLPIRGDCFLRVR
jgi:hypothetical protein